MSQPNHVTKQLYPDTNHHTNIQSTGILYLAYGILHVYVAGVIALDV